MNEKTQSITNLFEQATKFVKIQVVDERQDVVNESTRATKKEVKEI
jgi:hypothetical protein